MIYEATLFTTYQGQKCINRWNYLMTGTPAAATGSIGLLTAMGGIPSVVTPANFPGDTIMRAIQVITSTTMTFDALSVKAIYDVEDFYELPYVPQRTGAEAGTGASPLLAFGFRTSRTRQDIRRATKRFPGVNEEAMGAGGAIVSGTAAVMDILAEAMSDSITYDDEGNTLTYSPIVVSKQKYTVPESGREAYRYYPTLAEQMAHIAQSILWQPYAFVRSQTSRQYARGQ